MCIFCNCWLGENPEVDYLTGECEVKHIKGKCAEDSMEQYPMADDLCHSFKRNIVYM